MSSINLVLAVKNQILTARWRPFVFQNFIAREFLNSWTVSFVDFSRVPPNPPTVATELVGRSRGPPEGPTDA